MPARTSFPSPGLHERPNLSPADRVGLFAVTTGGGLDALVERFDVDDGVRSSIVAKGQANRLTEAFAECLYHRVRTELRGTRVGAVAGRVADPRSSHGPTCRVARYHDALIVVMDRGHSPGDVTCQEAES